jgi:sulfatase maturation enzyme AslB (radical SAM superfamily)
MLTERNISVLHIESTDVCQAACPLCARETDSTFSKTNQHHLTVEQILNVFEYDKITKLDKMFMCGNYGDPAAGRNTMEIFRKFRNINPNIVLGMNTNGALQSQQWWKELASILTHSRDYVVFSIDGLEDTNHIYRKNVSWKRLIENSSAFIKAGGIAHWDMLVYQHNEHQVNAAIELAKSLGFTRFRSKVSKRPLIDNLSYPVNWHRSNISTGIINCIALNEQSIYLDCHGVLHPCCWQHTIFQDRDIQKLEASWQSSDPDAICAFTCRSNKQGNNFNNQWKLELALK